MTRAYVATITTEPTRQSYPLRTKLMLALAVYANGLNELTDADIENFFDDDGKLTIMLIPTSSVIEYLAEE